MVSTHYTHHENSSFKMSDFNFLPSFEIELYDRSQKQNFSKNFTDLIIGEPDINPYINLKEQEKLIKFLVTLRYIEDGKTRVYQTNMVHCTAKMFSDYGIR